MIDDPRNNANLFLGEVTINGNSVQPYLYGPLTYDYRDNRYHFYSAFFAKKGDVIYINSSMAKYYVYALR